MAYLVLVAGYYLGYRDLVAGLYPSSTVLVGIISNSGAFLLLVVGSVIGVWSSWGVLAKAFMWSSIIATGSIALKEYTEVEGAIADERCTTTPA